MYANENTRVVVITTEKRKRSCRWEKYRSEDASKVLVEVVRRRRRESAKL
jgi:hypothetical protein